MLGLVSQCCKVGLLKLAVETDKDCWVSSTFYHSFFP
jgi:hypothetical protein